MHIPATTPSILATPTTATTTLADTTAGRNNNFNLLRLILASLVIVSHGPELVYGDRNHEILTRIFGTRSFGDIAVDGFFLLSGFLIVKSWELKPKLKTYFEKRIRRIYPGFVVAILLSVFLFAPLGVASVAAYFAQINYATLLWTTLTLHMPDLPSLFVGRPYALINGALWSIAYEFRCYVIVAVLGLLGGPKRQRWLWLVLTGLGLLAVSFPTMLVKSGLPFQHSLENFSRLFTFFGVGACFYLFRDHIPLKSYWAALAVLILLPLMFYPITESVARATVGAYALFWFAFAPIPALSIFQRTSDVSYGIYLYGWPIQKVLDWYFPGAPLWVLVFATLVIAYGFGYASWRLVESPLLKKSQKARHVQSEPTATNG